MLISTLKELFRGNKKLFKDLWIEKSEYKWQEHPIIHLDFSTLDIETSQKLKISLSSILDDIAIQYKLDISHKPSPGLKVKSLIEQLSKKNPVVILIDEYDYPLLGNIENLKIAKSNQKVLNNFFAVLKSTDEYLRTIFITGVTKFAKTSIFSGHE